MLAMIRRTIGEDPNLHVRPEALDLVQRAKAADRRVGILSTNSNSSMAATTWRYSRSCA